MFRIRLFATASIGALLFSSSAFAADPKDDSNDIVVTGVRQEKSARKEQQIAPNLVNIQSAEAIAKYPDYNAAEALSRIPGVQLSIDTGEGRFVSIRGIDGNLNGATFGNTVLLNTNAGGVSFTGSGRAVEFDTVPVGAIDGLIVTKTGLPDHDAEGIGGSIELKPRTALGHDRLFVEATLGEGYEPKRKSTNLTDEFVIGGGFGTNANGNKLFHIVLTQNEHNDGRGFDDIEIGSYTDDGALAPSKIQDKVLTQYQLRRYQYHRERYGYSAALDITPSTDHHIFLRGNFAGYQERVNRQIVSINGLSNVTGITGNVFNVASGVSLTNTLRDEKESHRNTLAQLGGEHHFGKVKFDWLVGYERAVYDKPFDYNTTFTGPGGLAATYDNVTDPDHPAISVTGANIADPTIYSLTRYQNSVEYTADREYSYAANLSVPVGIATNDEFKFGGTLRYRQKYDIYTGNIRRNFTGGSGPLLSTVTGLGPFSNFYGLYNTGYEGNAALLSATYGASVQPTAANGLLPFVTTNTNDLLFNDTENIAAGYAQYSGDIDKLHFVIGARVENTKAIYGGFSNVAPSAGAVADVNGNYLVFPSKAYTNVFPNLQLRYKPSSNVVIRGVYSTSISRPGFNQTVQQQSVSNSDPAALAVTTGNPDLKPAYSHNFDLSFEYYLSNSGIFSIGLFDKEIRNFVAARTFKQQATFGGVSGLYTYTSFANVSGTYDRGIEVSYVQKFSTLPAPFDGLGLDTNFTYNKSRVALHDNSTFAQAAVAGSNQSILVTQSIPGTAEFTGNFAVFYEAHKIRTRLALKYDGSTVFTINGTGLQTFAAPGVGTIGTDDYLAKRVTLDWTGAYDFNKHVAFYASVKNITDAPLKYYEGTSNRPIQREFYGQTYEAGVKVKF